MHYTRFKDVLKPSGFALIATLSMMILLVVVAVGLLSLSSVALRSSTIGNAENKARANAKMALMMAIGELQKYTGPDTRVTAPSSIIDPESPPIIGAWRSWEGTDHSSAGDDIARPIVPDYSVKTRSEADAGRFIKWLVSSAIEGGDVTAPSNLAFKEEQSNTIPLLAEGTLGDVSTDQIHVIPTQIYDDGRMAWWVSGENQKSRLMQPYKSRSESEPHWADMNKSHSVPDPEVYELTSLHDNADDFTRKSVNAKSAARAITLATTDLLEEGVKPSQHFHDISTTSVGLLTNTATGGWRKDLSILSEKWDNISTNHNGGLLPLFQIVPGSEGATEVSKPTLQNLTADQSIFYPWSNYRSGNSAPDIHGATASWPALIDYITSYKTINYDSGSGVASTPLKWSRLRANGASSLGPLKKQETYDFLHSVRKSPVLARVQWLFCVQAVRLNKDSNNKRYQIRVLSIPTYTLWNPYNVAIDINGSYGVGMNKPFPAAIGFGRGDEAVPFPDSQYRRYARGSIYPAGYDSQISKYKNQLYGMDGEAGGFPTNFSLSPGAVTTFSPSESSAGGGGTGNILELEEGYDGSKANGYKTSYSVSNLNWGDALRTDIRLDSITKFAAAASRQGPGIMMTFGGRGPGGWSKYITDIFTEYSCLYNLEYSQAFWKAPADIPLLPVSQIATHDTSNPGKPTGNRPWTPVFSVVFGPRLTIGAGAGNQSDRPTKGTVQSSPLVTSVDTTSLPKPQNHPTNGAYDFSFHGHEPNSDTLPEDSNGPGYIYSGFLPGNGLSRFMLCELPLRPISSLVELQGWDLRAHNPMPPFQFNLIGNSDATPMIPMDDIVIHRSANPSINLQHDDAYCANHLLFDDWFFSSIAPEPRDFGQSISKTIEEIYEEYLMGIRELNNRSYRPILMDRSLESDEAQDRIDEILGSTDGWLKVASRFEVDGMFNINSTSVKAWRALLGHARNMKVAHHSKGGIILNPTEENHVVSRFSVASDTKAGPGKGMGGDFPNSSEYTGYRTLNDEQLDELAEKIVGQVRKRGPFLSLSEFINRKLDTDEELAMAGAVQVALNNLTEDPNKLLRDPAYASNTIDPQDVSMVGAGYNFPNASKGTNTHGAPGWIRQADVLRPLAPILTARDDSFTIRAYGDVQDNSGKVIARAWCEAIVHRTRDFVDNQDIADDPSGPTIEQNLTFGRRYVITSFRWLVPSEV